MTSEATAGQVPDIYGQVHPVETPELIAKKIAEFDSMVNERVKAKEEEDTDLIKAIQKCPALLTEDFKLVFLRCEVFNADLAVARYVHYWTKRVEIFGEEKAFQPMTLDRALSEDSIALGLGMATLLKGVSDPKGRAIVFMDPSMQDRSKYDRSSMARAIWYVVHAALESETAQKHGVVLIGDPSRAKLSQFDRKLMKKFILPSLHGAIPIRLAALHICKPPTFFSVILPILKMFMSKRVKKRLLLHSGNNENVQKSLAPYGIDKSVLPEELGGTVKRDTPGWLDDRRSRQL